MTGSETQVHGNPETLECPFSDCDWATEYDADCDASEISAENSAELHYEREHAGRVRIQVTIEKEQILGPREPKDIREREIERWEERGHDVAHVRTEVLEEADLHDDTAEKA